MAIFQFFLLVGKFIEVNFFLVPTRKKHFQAIKIAETFAISKLKL